MKNIGNIIFCLFFLAMLVLPFAFTNFERDVISEIDNEYLPELETESIEAFVKSADGYLDKRIGFRVQALELYQQINDKLFHEMEHPNHRYGKNGHIYYKAEDDRYILDWQHLNLNDEWAQGFAKGIKSFQDYAESKDKRFIYMLIPDKKTIYPEYFPDGFNVKGELSRTDQVLSYLDENRVNYYWAKDTMLEGKKTMPVNNQKYDVSHWNENGAFIVLSELYTRLGLSPLDINDYVVTEKLEKYLPNSEFVINESVPLYTLKQENAILDRSWIEVNELRYPGETVSYFSYHHNPKKTDEPRILVIHDSYLAEKEKFFFENFSETFFLHRYNIYNLEWFKYYVDKIDPDIIVYENPERSWEINLYK